MMKIKHQLETSVIYYYEIYKSADFVKMSNREKYLHSNAAVRACSRFEMLMGAETIK